MSKCTVCTRYPSELGKDLYGGINTSGYANTYYTTCSIYCTYKDTQAGFTGLHRYTVLDLEVRVHKSGIGSTILDPEVRVHRLEYRILDKEVIVHSPRFRGQGTQSQI